MDLKFSFSTEKDKAPLLKKEIMFLKGLVDFPSITKGYNKG